MSCDMVDDLHAAEDRIGVLELALSKLLAGYKDAVLVGNLAVPGLADAGVNAEFVMGETYCRPSCEDDDEGEAACGVVDCGCPCHVEVS